MNKQLWILYKESKRGKECIEMFNPDAEDVYEVGNALFEFSHKTDSLSVVQNCLAQFDVFCGNFFNSEFTEKLCDGARESFAYVMENYELKDLLLGEEGNIELGDLIMAKNKFRNKAALVQAMSVFLYLHFNFFKPMLYSSRFDVIQRNCDKLGIELPPIPRTKDYKEYLLYYYDICTIWNEFQRENGLNDAECCACIYDFATMLQETNSATTLPKPTNVWMTGAGGNGDFDVLDKLTRESCADNGQIWACNERTRRGDIIVMYCLSPRSYIHSIWRANSGGQFNPFDYYHCRTTVTDGLATPHISFNDLKADSYFSQVPIVRRNLQGINGVQLSAKDYAELLRLITEKGGVPSNYPKLFESGNIDFGEIKIEKDVEEKILIPMLKRLGYEENDWTRQLSQKAGRGLKAIPDFVFFPKGEKHFASAPFVIEAKFDMSTAIELRNAFSQCLSYARMLRSSLMTVCDKERLIVYKVNDNGISDINSPIFENHWASIYGDMEVGAQLNQLIGKEIVQSL